MSFTSLLNNKCAWRRRLLVGRGSQRQAIYKWVTIKRNVSCAFEILTAGKGVIDEYEDPTEQKKLKHTLYLLPTEYGHILQGDRVYLSLEQDESSSGDIEFSSSSSSTEASFTSSSSSQSDSSTSSASSSSSICNSSSTASSPSSSSTEASETSSSSSDSSSDNSSSSESSESSESSSDSSSSSSDSSSSSSLSESSLSSESFFSSTSSQSSSSSSTQAGESSSSSSSSIDDFDDNSIYYTVIDVDPSTYRNHHLEVTIEKLELSQDAN
jgi:hypothetical protein